MPAVRKKRGYAKKAYTRRRKVYKRKAGKRPTVTRSMTAAFPQKKVCKMIWTMDKTVSTGSAGAQSYYAFRQNSVYDPDYTVGIGDKSAYMFAELAGLYSNYRVMASKIEVSLLAAPGSTSDFHCGFYPSNQLIGSSYDVDARSASEKPMGRLIVLGLPTGSRASGKAHSYASTLWIVGDVSCKTDTQYVGAGGITPTDPQSVLYWNFVFDNVRNGTATSANGQFKITYWVEWFGLIPNLP